MTDDPLKDLFDSAAPDGPDLPPRARADAVRARARAVRRTTALSVAAAVVAVAGVGIGVTLLATGDGPDRRGTVADEGPSSTPTPAPPPCPTPPDEVGDQTLRADFPAGATSLRLCPAAFQGQAGVPFASTSLVTHDVDTLIDQIGSLPAFTIAPDCAAISLAPSPWEMVVAYPDGHTVAVGTTTTMCSSVVVDGHEVDVDSVLRLVVEAAKVGPGEAEETGTDAPGAATCPDPTSESGDLVAEPDTYSGPVATFDASSAVVCYSADPMGSREYRDTAGVLEGGDLQTVLTALRHDVTDYVSRVHGCTDTGPTRLLVLVGDQGRVTGTDDHCNGEFEFRNGGWIPDRASEQAIARALGGEVRRR